MTGASGLLGAGKVELIDTQRRLESPSSRNFLLDWLRQIVLQGGGAGGFERERHYQRQWLPRDGVMDVLGFIQSVDIAPPTLLKGFYFLNLEDWLVAPRVGLQYRSS